MDTLHGWIIFSVLWIYTPLHTLSDTHPPLQWPSKKDISTPPGPVLPCGWGCWGWGSRGLGGPWGQTCSPALPSWPPLPFFWLSQWTPGCLIFLHRPQEGHLSNKQNILIMLFCFKASQITFKAQKYGQFTLFWASDYVNRWMQLGCNWQREVWQW